MTGESLALTGKTVTMIIDFGAVLTVIICAAIGSYRGMIKMLAGLAVLLLSLVGATFIAAQFTDQVVDMAAPMLESRVTSAVESAMDGESLNKLIGGYTQTQEEATLEDTLDETSFRALKFDYLAELFERFKTEKIFPQTLTDALQSQIEDMRKGFTGTVSQALSAALKEILRPIVYGLLYLLSFTVLSFVLRIVFKSLDNVSAIPGLRSINAMGGLALGLIQGVAIVIAAAFLLRFVFAGLDGVSDSQALKALAIWFPSLAFPV